MITGAPNIGVIAFNGSIPDAPGNIHIRLHMSAITAPINIVKGSNDL